MIIVSREKDEILNFDNIMNIVVTDCEEDGFGIFAGVVVGVDDSFKLLGYYKTEKRAKEVLQSIIFKYSQISPGNNMVPKVYEMPKE